MTENTTDTKPNGDPSIKYTVKDMFIQIGIQFEKLNMKFDSLEEQLQKKTDEDKSNALSARLYAIEAWKSGRDAERLYGDRLLVEFRSVQDRVEALENYKSGNDAVSLFKRWAGPVVLMVGFSVLNYLSSHYR
jgi:hypothetical protein